MLAFQNCVPLDARVPTVGDVRCQRRATVRVATRRPRIVQASVGEEIEKALEIKFESLGDVSRVIKSFRAVREGRALERDAGTARHQRAYSFVEGLDAEPWHDIGTHSWVPALEASWRDIADELQDVCSEPALLKRGTNVWVPPVVDAARAYGPDWRTLVLQDREWDSANTELFPRTTAALRAAQVPSVEAFFARQLPNSGIALHTDDCNFIITAHLALDAPPGSSWIEVGGERRYWENGKTLIFDTSFFHRTKNESPDKDRTVLLLRFWHPGLTLVERDALSFLFDAIASPNSITDVLAVRSEQFQSRREAAMQREAAWRPEDATSRRERRRNSGGKSNQKRGEKKGFAK